MQNAIANRNQSGFPVAVYDVYPKSESYNGIAFYKDNSYYSRIVHQNVHGQMMPYGSDHWRETAARLKVTVPFQTIITRDMGKGKCRDCGQVYQGSSPEGCQRIVRKVDVQRHNGYGSDWSVTERHYHYATAENRKVKHEACNGIVQWDLESEFLNQQRFFGLLGELGAIATVNDTLGEFAGAFPSELVPIIRTKMLEARMIAFEGRCFHAFQQISSKMSQAGQALQF